MQATPPPEPPALVWTLRIEPFDPQENRRHPVRSLPDFLRLRLPDRAGPLVSGRQPRHALPARTEALAISWPRPRPWLSPVPDCLVALTVDVLVGAAGGHGSMLAASGTAPRP